MRVSKSKLGLLVALCICMSTISAEAAKRSKKARTSETSATSESVPAEEQVDLASLADILNSYSTLSELTRDLVRFGVATPEEKTAIVRFMQDRGIQPETPLEKVKYDSATSTLKWKELSLSVQPNGDLKNSFGQILKTSDKTLDTVFGEAYLSFDRRTSRARVMDLFLQEAVAADTGATPGARAWGAVTAGIYSSLRAAKSTGMAVAGGLFIGTGWTFERFWTGFRNSMYKNTVRCGPKGEFIVQPGSQYMNLGDLYHKRHVEAETASANREESLFGKDWDNDSRAAVGAGVDAIKEAIRSMKTTLVLPPNRKGEMLIAPELLQAFFGPKVPKCDQPKAEQMKEIVRAKGTTPKEKIRNAEIGKGYGPGVDRNWDDDVAAAKRAGSSSRSGSGN